MGEPIQVGGPKPDGRRRIMLLAGGAALVILAVVVLPGLLFGDGGGGEAFEFPPPAQSGESPPASPGEAVPETVESFSSKNPFRPLAEVGGGGEAPAETTDTSVPPGFDDPIAPFPGDTVPPGDGSVVAPPAGDPGESGTDTPPTTTPGPPPRTPDRVAMLEVFTDPGGQVVATIRVNDVVHQVAEGDEFATSYRVLSLDLGTRCGQLLFGDERFGLCEGDEALK